MKKKYVQIGLGGRARFYYESIASDYKDTSELVAFCDVSKVRMDYANKIIHEKYGHPIVPTYFYNDFEKMLEDTKPDYVLVTSVDRTHHDYIIRSMEKGYDVITEKPMTIDEKKYKQF